MAIDREQNPSSTLYHTALRTCFQLFKSWGICRSYTSILNRFKRRSQQQETESTLTDSGSSSKSNVERVNQMYKQIKDSRDRFKEDALPMSTALKY